MLPINKKLALDVQRMTKLGIYLLMYILIKLTSDLISLSWMLVSSEGRHYTEKTKRCANFLPGAGQWRRWRASSFFLEPTRHITSFSVMETDRLSRSFLVSRARHPSFPWPPKDNCFPQPRTKWVALLCVPQGWDTVIQKNFAWLATKMRTEIFSAQLTLQSLLLLCMHRSTQGQTY